MIYFSSNFKVGTIRKVGAPNFFSGTSRWNLGPSTFNLLPMPLNYITFPLQIYSSNNDDSWNTTWDSLPNS